MGEHSGWDLPSGLVPNGLLLDEVAGVTRALDTERWMLAEQQTAELIARIQPNQPSEERRNAVANYVQRLIMKCFSCQVFTFGSVPLKTYLPDGDIDLTAISKNENLKDTWASEVRDMLENEEKSETAEFHVKEVQYIQAEVKIIKCLVENIVVDISFNQVGGLCTLCFLEEIDLLINQNHLFKRSIILIKAWCYYESRILGAHHGLISTYALETLVLYIFHVFNNSFAGPLEVLYRFLEFFSNFDWDNFCVSLWGPVPINSLPDMTAQPPRKDGGELLLCKNFLSVCSTRYAVFPGGQENHTQPFVSKHFNVIDPLRANNNLGRSVSKGNFYRIRSAFAFGAKRLARLLECPKENLITEVNEFFFNTWERHGRGSRPDAPSLSLRKLRLVETVEVEEPNNSTNSTSIETRSDNIGLAVARGHHSEGCFTFQGSNSQVLTAISQHSQDIRRSSNPTSVSRTQSQKSSENQLNFQVSDQFERSNSSCSSIPVDKSQKSLKSDYLVNDRDGEASFQFSRTRSSPELTDTFVEVSSTVRRDRFVNTGKEQNSHVRSDYHSRRKNLGSEVSSGPDIISSVDDPSRRHTSHQSLDAAADSQGILNYYPDDSGFASMREEFNSVLETSELQQDRLQEEQDFVNMTANSSLNNFNGHFQFPMQLSSPHLPLPFSPVLASIGYAQRNMAGMIPTNIPLIDPSWGPNVQFPQGLVSSPLPHYFPTSNQNANPNELIESSNESSCTTDLKHEDADHNSWQENDAGTGRGVEPDNGAFYSHHVDDMQRSTSNSYNFISSSRASNSAAPERVQHKYTRENRGPGGEDAADNLRYQANRVNDIYSVDRNGNMRFFPVSQSSFSRTKSGFDNFKDGSAAKVNKSARDKWGRKPMSPAVMTSLYSKSKSEWQSESSSDHISVSEDGDSREWIPLSTMGSEVSERTAGSASSAGPHGRGHRTSGYEQVQMNGSDSVIPIAPMLVGGSRQRPADNRSVPLTFYPTGPPVPFVTMLPVYNFPSEAGSSDASSNRFEKDEGVDHSHVNQSDQYLDLAGTIGRSEARTSSTNSNCSAPEFPEPEVLKPDILNSDFFSHWQNLQYGRFCENARHHGPLIYPSSVVVPPVYLQGHFPLESPGRPISTNVNLVTNLMNYGPRLVPVSPLQLGPNRPSGSFHRYGDEAPRFRGGTGTYLPNPKVSYRDRQSSNTRNHRGNYNYDRSDHVDREGSWVNSKSRAAGRNHGRNQVEKPNTRLDRLAAAESRSDRQGDGLRHEPVSTYQAQSSSFGSTRTGTNSASLRYGMYPLPAMGSNGVGPTGPAVPSVVMLYSYDQGVRYGTSAESLEFGSLGQVRISDRSEVLPQNDGNQVGEVVEQRHGALRRGSPRFSPDQPSSPHVQR